MNRLYTILLTVFCLTLTITASSIDYPTYNGPTRSVNHSAWSPSDAAWQEEDEYNNTQSSFNSTSPYTRQIDPNMYRSVNTMTQEATSTREYSVPVSAVTVTGGVTTVDLNGENNAQGVLRVRHRPDGDPNDNLDDPETPIGDAPWLFMLLMAAAYAAYSYRRHKV